MDNLEKTLVSLFKIMDEKSNEETIKLYGSIINELKQKQYDNPEDFNYLVYEINNILDNVIKILHPQDEKTQFKLNFVFKHYNIIKNNIEKLIILRQKSCSCSVDKSRHLINAYVRYLSNNKIPTKPEYRQYWIPNFGSYFEWFEFIESIQSFYYGHPEKYIKIYNHLLNCKEDDLKDNYRYYNKNVLVTIDDYKDELAQVIKVDDSVIKVKLDKDGSEFDVTSDNLKINKEKTDIGNSLLAFIYNKGYTKAQLAKECNIKSFTLNKFIENSISDVEFKQLKETILKKYFNDDISELLKYSLREEYMKKMEIFNSQLDELNKTNYKLQSNIDTINSNIEFIKNRLTDNLLN